MRPHDLSALLKDLPTLDLRAKPTYEQAMAAALDLGTQGECDVGVARFTGQPPWERHAGDEFLHVLDGEVELTLLIDAGEQQLRLVAGSVLIVPAGVWHRTRTRARERVTVLFSTPREGGESSMAENPLV